MTLEEEQEEYPWTFITKGDFSLFNKEKEEGSYIIIDDNKKCVVYENTDWIKIKNKFGELVGE